MAAAALALLPEIGSGLAALGKAGLALLGIGAAASLSGDTQKTKSQTTSTTISTGKCHGNCKDSQKPQHGYKIYDKRTGEIMEYGISGQRRTVADYLATENNSPRIRSKLRTKYGGNPNYAGSVMIDGMPNRAVALEWERGQVRAHQQKYGVRPPRQGRPINLD